MKLLLDECIDRRLTKELVGHEVKTAPQMGWAGIKNGELLTRASTEGMKVSGRRSFLRIFVEPEQIKNHIVFPTKRSTCRYSSYGKMRYNDERTIGRT